MYLTISDLPLPRRPNCNHKGREGNSFSRELKLTFSSPATAFPGVKASLCSACKLTLRECSLLFRSQRKVRGICKYTDA